MPIFVKYQLQVDGLKTVERAMDTIEQRADRLNRRTSRAAPGNRTQAAANAEREAERLARAQAKVDERAQKASVRAFEKAERDKTKIAAAEAKKRQLEEERYHAYNRKLRDQHFREEERRTLRSRAQWQNTTRGVVGGTARGVTNFATGALAMAGIGGTALAANAVHGFMRDKAQASSLANQLAPTGATKEEIEKTKLGLLASAQQVKGATAEEVMRGQSAFHAVAGEGEATKKIGQKLVTTQLATGGSIEDIGGMYSAVYASLRNASGGAQKSVDQLIEETDQMGRVFAAMGAKGAIELKDFAQIGSTVAAVAGRYGGDRSANIKHVAAVAQVARQTGGADSAAEAATAISGFTADLIQHSKEARAMGLDVFEKGSSGTKLKQMPDVIAELLAATGGNLEKLSGVANIRGIKSVMGFTDPYLDAYKAAKAGGAGETEAKEAGKTAVRKSLSEFGGADFTAKDFEARASSRLSDEDKQIEQAMKEFNVAVGTQLVPAVTKLVPELSKLVPYVVSAASAVSSFVRAFAENPVKGIGALVGAFLVKELAAAGIAKGIGAALNATSGARTAPVGNLGTGGKVGAALGALSMGTAAFAITDAILNISGEVQQKSAETASQQLGQLYSSYAAQRSEILGSNESPEEKAQRLQKLGENTWRNVNLTQEAGGTGLMGAMPEWFQNAFGSGTAQQVDKSSKDFQAQIAKDMQEAAKMQLEAAKIAASGAGGSPTVPNRGNTKSPVI